MYLIRATQYLLCLVSMLLTGLFALNFSSTATVSLPSVVNGPTFLAPFFMVVVGMGIDFSNIDEKRCFSYCSAYY